MGTLSTLTTHYRRCYGNFFTCHDQQPFRTDAVDMEEVVLRDQTNYYGYVAWGEYPHCFAAVLNQAAVHTSILQINIPTYAISQKNWSYTSLLGSLQP